MRLYALPLLAFLYVAAPAHAQAPPKYTVEDFAATVDPQDLRLYLTVLASPQLEGRETATPGNDAAADFLAGQLSGFGIKPLGAEGSYFQDIPFSRTEWAELGLQVNDQPLEHLKDFLCFRSLRPNAEQVSGEEVVFLGYGIDDPKYSDYGADVRGKAILIYQGEPVTRKGRYRISGNKNPSQWSSDWTLKLEAAKKHGVTAIYLLVPDFQRLAGQMRRFALGPDIALGANESAAYPPMAMVSTTTARALMGDRVDDVIKMRDRINKGKQPEAIALKARHTFTTRLSERTVTGHNVLGYIEGSDPALKDELVVLTAHYDHLGRTGDDTYFGADDNASGTSTLLEMAQAFALAKQKGMGPRRSVLVLFVTGEEKGLLGSRYYTENPVFPLASTVANVNVDMVGRTDDRHKTSDYIYVIGSDKISQDLHDINEAMNAAYTKLELDYTYNDEKDPNRYYYRSDHYNFAEKGVPAIFFFSGVHADYHRPSDTADKIDYERMAKVGRLVFHTTWELANRDERPRKNK